MYSQTVRFLIVVTLCSLMPTWLHAQQPAEQPSVICPPDTPCRQINATTCAEELTCPEIALLPRICTPSCSPKVCDGAVKPVRFDVTRDCRIDTYDIEAITREINRRTSGGAPLPNEWFDTNSDGTVGPLDVVAVVDLLNDHGCVPPPPCRPVLCDGTTADAALDVNADCRLTIGDSIMITDEINRRASGRGANPSQWFDTNRDGLVNSNDSAAVTNALTARGCN
jgi:hypothetical protein